MKEVDATTRRDYHHKEQDKTSRTVVKSTRAETNGRVVLVSANS